MILPYDVLVGGLTRPEFMAALGLINEYGNYGWQRAPQRWGNNTYLMLLKSGLMFTVALPACGRDVGPITLDELNGLFTLEALAHR